MPVMTKIRSGYIIEHNNIIVIIYSNKINKAVPVTGLEWPRGFQEVKVPRFHDNGTG
jgi:hypothetical protein